MSTREFTWTPLSFINDAADKLGFGQLFSHFLLYYFVLLFLHLLVSLFFLLLVFHPVLAWRTQKPIHCHCCKTCIFLFGYVWKWGDLFSLQRNHFGVKKGHFMLRHTHLLIYCFGHVFLLPCCVGLPHLKHIRLKLPHHIRRGHQVRILKSNWNFEPYKLHQWCQRASQVTKRHLGVHAGGGWYVTGMGFKGASHRKMPACTLVPGYGRTSQVTKRHLACTPESVRYVAKPVTNPKLTIASRTWVRPYKACDKS